MTADEFARWRRASRFGSSPLDTPPAHFGSTEHLASEVVAAYVDGELRMNAYLRASRHLALCPECAAEVDAQQQARAALRHAGQVSMPIDLLCALTRIPEHSGDQPEFDEVAIVRRWSLWWRK
jgi:hypothetical protein